MEFRELIAKKVTELKPSGIRKFFDLLETMEDAISLGVGEPDFQTPWHIRDAGVYSLEKGFTKYTPWRRTSWRFWTPMSPAWRTRTKA